jgi:hypothetical protein
MNSKQILHVFFIVVTMNIVTSKPQHHKKRKSSNLESLPAELRDEVHGVKMGIPYSGCDDAKSRLEVDYDGSPLNYTCFDSKHRYKLLYDVKPLLECDNIPHKYVPKHVCMDVPLAYDAPVPTYGDHRPLWPKYGEYLFVPVQRWLHNVEHGAIVLLYHPCADPSEVRLLKEVVRNCLRRHIITPYAELPPERPIALVAWGCRLMMNHFVQDDVVRFIKKHALWGPEWSIDRDGQYNMFLLKHAEMVEGSDISDKELCITY